MKTTENLTTDYGTHTIDAEGNLQITDLRNFYLRLSATFLDARTYARFGSHLTRNAPTLKDSKARYGLPANVRSYADAVPYLDSLREIVKAELDRQLEPAV